MLQNETLGPQTGSKVHLKQGDQSYLVPSSLSLFSRLQLSIQMEQEQARLDWWLCSKWPCRPTGGAACQPAAPSPGGGGEEEARSASEERAGNLDSQIPKESVSLCQGKGHPARVHSKGGVTSNKV